MSVFKSTYIISIRILASRLLGFVRDILIAQKMGASVLSDAFFIAFKLPNFFRRLFAEGAFTAAFVPVMVTTLDEDGKEEAQIYAGQVLSLMLIVLTIITILAELFMPAVMTVLAPGFKKNPEQFETVVFLGRIMFPYLIFVTMLSLWAGVLNSIHRFAAGASAQILLNVFMIAALVWLVAYTDTPATALAIGVVAAGVGQFLWVFVALKREGMRIRLQKPQVSGRVRTMLQRMMPGIISGGVVQINIWIDTIIATLVPNGVSYLYYADRLTQFPLALIGTAMGIALLPTLTQLFWQGEIKEANRQENKALEYALLLTLPSAAALVIIAEPLIMTMFQHGAFTPEATKATSLALAAYAMGLPAFVMVKIFSPGFFAIGDTKTPLKVAIVCLVVNVCLNLALVVPLGHVGIAIATTVSSWLNVILLRRKLNARRHFKASAHLKKMLVRQSISAAIMGVALWATKKGLYDLLNDTLADRILFLAILVTVGVVTYALAVHVTKACNVRELITEFKGKPEQSGQ